MANKFPFSMWVYNPLSDFTPDELEIWKEAGMTTPLAPKTYYGKDDPRILIPYLDRAHELGMQLIVNYEDFSYGCIDEVGDEEYERRLREVYEPLKGHPALYGFYSGDEPSSRKDFDQTERCYAIHKKVAPELKPYVNLVGGMSDKGEKELGGLTLEEWFKSIKKLGIDFASQDAYECMINDTGVTNYLKEMRGVVEAAEKAGVDIWTNMLCSGHDAFRSPSESDVIWQINVAAAIGCRGGIWFRFYDREIGYDYYGSPIDEFGNKTDVYYSILRAQRRFNTQYGELLMSLKRKSTYMTGYKKRDVYPELHDNVHDLVTVKGYEDGIISFFEDEDGKEYLVITNASIEFRASWDVLFDPSKCNVVEVSFNGKAERPLTEDDGDGDIVCTNQPYYIGQMRGFRIDRK